jgi:hypothetical protein
VTASIHQRQRLTIVLGVSLPAWSEVTWRSLPIRRVLAVVLAVANAVGEDHDGQSPVILA